MSDESVIMKYQHAQVIIDPLKQGGHCEINAHTLLSDVAHEHPDLSHSYLLVEDNNGALIGIVGAKEIHDRISSLNAGERRRWLNTPVEAAVRCRMAAPSKLLERPATDERGLVDSCAAISSCGQFQALVTENDVFVSWRAVEQVLQQALDDHVTGLPTRAAFDAHLRAECGRAARRDHSVGVILIDIDLFKQTNDQFGHAVGDAVLRAVGKTLRSTFRSYDMVARFGGDEFAVLCCGCRPGEIDFTIERLRRGMLKLHSDLSIPRPVPTLSIGACVVHNAAQMENPDQIIETADECLYFAKRGGRNRSFTTELGAESRAPC